MGKTKGVRMRHPLAYDQIKLGDLTLDVENPWNDCREFPHQLGPNDIFPVDKLNLENLQSDFTEGEAQAQLTAFFDAQANQSQKSFQRESASRARVYRIRGSGDRFKDACKDPEIRKWLTDYYVKGDVPVYMVVGLYTFEKNAHLAEGAAAKLEGSGKAGGGDLGGLLSATGRGRVSTGDQHATIFTTDKETIFAMEYRKVKKQWFSKNIDKALLEQGNRWEVFAGMRGTLGPESDEEKSVVDVDLTDDDAEDVDNTDVLFDA